MTPALRPGVLAAAALALAACVAVAASEQTADAWEPPRMPDGRPDLQGIWIGEPGEPLEPMPAVDAGETTPAAQATAAEPPRTPLGRARATAVQEGSTFPAGPEDLDNTERCITAGVPQIDADAGAQTRAAFQIVQTPTHVAFIEQAQPDARLVPLDERPHLPEQIRQWNGDPRGRWEGDTLVVETTNFSAKSHFRGAADGLHVAERFTRSAPEALTYRVTLTDPTTWEQPWTVTMTLQRRDQPLPASACHEQNRLVETMLETLGTARRNR